MAVTLGINAGFVTTSPTTDPAGSDEYMDDQTAVVKHITPAGATTITEVGWWCNNANEATNYRMALYAADGSGGIAGTLLQVTSSTAKGTTAGWKKITVDWSISASTNYWIGLEIDDTSTPTDTNWSSSGGSGYDYQTGGDTFSDPYGGGTVTYPTGMITAYALVELDPSIPSTSQCGSNATSTTIGITLPSYSSGDLIVVGINYWQPSGTDNDITWPSGPNSETITSIATDYGGSGAYDVPLIALGYYIATDAYAGGTWNITADVGTRWAAAILKYGAGYFNTTTPISSATSQDFSSTDETAAVVPAFSANSNDTDGTIYSYIAVDQDPLNTTMPSGYTLLENLDQGRAVIGLATRDAAVTSAESIGSATFDLSGAGTDAWAAYSIIVKAPSTGPTLQINISDVWKSSAAVSINIGDTWKTVSSISINIGDTWKVVA